MEGSASQAGFYYQNNVAALKVIDCLFFESDINYVRLENYDHGNHIDDVIIYKKSSVDYYQIKWSEDGENVFTLFSLLSAQSHKKSIFKQLAEGYAGVQSQNQAIKIHLFTTKRSSNQKRPSENIHHGLSELLSDFLGPFQNQELPYYDFSGYTNYAATIEKIRKECGLEKDSFDAFLRSLSFLFNQEPLAHIQSAIKFKLSRLGIESALYEKLIDGIVNWSISGEAVTKNLIEKQLGILDRFEDKLSQFFRVVDDKYYIPNTTLADKLSKSLTELSGGYIFIEGLPGIGKSTALTKFKQSQTEITLTYYCFIPDTKYNFGELRHKAVHFLKSLCISIENAFPEIDFPAKYSDRFDEKLTVYLDTLSQLKQRVVIVVDGLDHVHRDLEFKDSSLLSHLKGSLPKGIFFILSSQYPAVLSESVRQEVDSDSRRHIVVTKFTQNEIERYLIAKGLKPDDILNHVERVSGGIPLYLHYISELLINSGEQNFETVLTALPNLTDGKINTYHESLYKKIENDEFSKWVLAILAYRREPTDVDSLHKILKNAGESKSITDIINVIKQFSHLLKVSNATSYSIFHNSFREFILTKTSDLKDRFNKSLIQFYEQQPHSDEAYRNYFRHLFEAADFEKIVSETTLSWMKSAWTNFRTTKEIQDNIDLAIRATIEISSLSEFVRIAFLKTQLDRLTWNLENSEIDFSILFLNSGHEANSIRSIWDGDFILTSKEYFSYYLLQYYSKTGRLLPDSIIRQGLSNTFKENNSKNLATVFTTEILAEEDPVAIFNEIDTIEWVHNTNEPGSYDKKPLPDAENRKINFSLKLEIINQLQRYGRMEALDKLSNAFPKKPKLTLRIKIAFYTLLLRIDKESAIRMLSTLDISLCKLPKIRTVKV